MNVKYLLSRTVALLCAAVLCSTFLICRAADFETRSHARHAIFSALEKLGFDIAAPITISTTPESEAADPIILENACVIGHSHAVGMQTALDVKGLDYIAEVGLMAGSMLTHQEFSLPSGDIGSLRMGLAAKDYDRIYVLLGSNDVPGGSAHLPSFRRSMEKLLDVLMEYQNEADIYLLSIAPLGESFYRYCHYNHGLTPDIFDEYNYVLRSLAIEHDAEYLDITSALRGEDGFLAAEYDQGDGLHFNAAGNQVILDSILTHTED